MRIQNIAVFSSGNAVNRGITKRIQLVLEQQYNCRCKVWNEDFFLPNDTKNIALLPSLLKKIPTFDFAILVADDCDTLHIKRHDKEAEEVNAVRDNVIFELGLSIMALGTQKTLLLSKKTVHLPDDIKGVGGMGIFISEFEDEKNESDLDIAIKRLGEVINKEKEQIFPIVIGAAGSAASAYSTNLVKRFFDTLLSKEKSNIIYVKDSQKKEVSVSLDNIKMNILVPTEITDNLGRAIESYYKGINSVPVVIEPAKGRSISVHMLMENGELLVESGKYVIIDVPTVLTASYETVKNILSLDADDTFDNNGKERFLMKEADLFRFSLNKMVDGWKNEPYYKNICIKSITPSQLNKFEIV